MVLYRRQLPAAEAWAFFARAAAAFGGFSPAALLELLRGGSAPTEELAVLTLLRKAEEGADREWDGYGPSPFGFGFERGGGWAARYGFGRTEAVILSGGGTDLEVRVIGPVSALGSAETRVRAAGGGAFPPCGEYGGEGWEFPADPARRADALRVGLASEPETDPRTLGMSDEAMLSSLLG